MPLNHLLNIFFARNRQPFHQPELSVRVKVANPLKFVEPLKDRFNLFMVFPAIHNASAFSVCGLHGKCLFDNKTVLKLIPKEVTETFSLIYLRILYDPVPFFREFP